MAHVSKIEDKLNIKVRCPDGFSNQLRLMLAGSYLKMCGYIHEFNQQWVINNHNNVPFLDYFEPLPKVNLHTISPEYLECEVIDTCSFRAMIETLTKGNEKKVEWQQAFQFISKYFIPKKEIQDFLNFYISKHDIKNCLGLHVRRTCKTALLHPGDDAYRLKESILTNEEILNIAKTYDTVFLATDNKETQSFFKERLKNNVITFAEVFSGEENFGDVYNRDFVKRHTSPLHTVMDFLILQHCNKFLGTSESSLSILVKLIRDNPDDFPLNGRL